MTRRVHADSGSSVLRTITRVYVSPTALTARSPPLSLAVRSNLGNRCGTTRRDTCRFAHPIPPAVYSKRDKRRYLSRLFTVHVVVRLKSALEEMHVRGGIRGRCAPTLRWPRFERNIRETRWARTVRYNPLSDVRGDKKGAAFSRPGTRGGKKLTHDAP